MDFRNIAMAWPKTKHDHSDHSPIQFGSFSEQSSVGMQDGHPVSDKIDQEREDKSDNGRACAAVAEMIQCSSFQKIYLCSQNDCDNASIVDLRVEALS